VALISEKDHLRVQANQKTNQLKIQKNGHLSIQADQKNEIT
jgi:hypothetical protein